MPDPVDPFIATPSIVQSLFELSFINASMVEAVPQVISISGPSGFVSPAKTLWVLPFMLTLFREIVSIEVIGIRKYAPDSSVT